MTKKSDNAQLSIVVPKALKRWVQHQARSEGINAAAWVRRILMQQRATRQA